MRIQCFSSLVKFAQFIADGNGLKIEIHHGNNLVILSRDACDETVHLNFIRQPNKTRHVAIYVFNDKLEKCPTYSMSAF